MYEYIKSLGYEPVMFFGKMKTCPNCDNDLVLYSVKPQKRILVCARYVGEAGTLSANKYEPGCGHTVEVMSINPI